MPEKTKRKIDFRFYQISIDKQIPTVETFSAIGKDTISLYTENSLNEIQVESTSDFLWFIGREGKNFPYSQDVVDLKTKEYMKNPKKSTQVELNKQWFAMYHYASQCFVSSSDKKKLISDFLKDKLQKKVLIKNYYKDKDEFLKELEQIKSIRFITKKDLLTSETDIFKDNVDLLGLGDPDQIRLSFDYSYAQKTSSFIHFFETLCNKYQSGYLTSLVVVGAHTEADSRIESIFNIRNISQSTGVFCEEDENGMFSPSEVQKALLEKFSVKDK